MLKLCKLQESLLLFLGHSIIPKDEAKFNIRNIFLVVILVTSYPILSFAFDNTDDVKALTACLSIFFTTSLTLQKTLTYLFHRKNIGRLVEVFSEMYQKKLDSHTDNYLAAANKWANWLGRAYFYSCSSTAAYILLSPIIDYIIATIRHTEYNLVLPEPMKFHFFDYLSSPGYELAYVFTVFSMSSVVVYASAIDGIFITLAFNLRAHFQELQHDIRMLNYHQTQEKVDRQLIDIVRQHVFLLKMTEQLRRMYWPIVFAQFSVTSLDLGVILYQITTNLNSVMSQISYISFLVSVMLQLFIYCYGGELIKIEGLNIDKAIQSSNWYDATPKQRRSLLLIMMRSQRDILMKAGIYEASLANYMTVCRAALSFIALIQSVA